MKLIIDISEYQKKWIGNLHFIPEEITYEIGDAIIEGTPLDSVINDIRKELEQFIKAPNFGDLSLGAICGAMKALEIIDKHLIKE